MVSGNLWARKNIKDTRIIINCLNSILILTIFKPAKTINDIATLELPDLPAEPYLRPQTWTAIKILYQVVKDVHLIKNSVSLSTRSLALNRALGEIKWILDQSKSLPEAEQGLIIDIFGFSCMFDMYLALC